MEEIQVGEYVRTNNLRGIKKIDKINEEAPMNRYLSFDGYDHNDKVYAIIRADQIVKHSFNIIDLIEVGDIVEVEDMGDNRIIHINDDRYLKDFKGYVTNEYFEVKSLLTHEQFESMKYVVGDK